MPDIFDIFLRHRCSKVNLQEISIVNKPSICKKIAYIVSLILIIC